MRYITKGISIVFHPVFIVLMGFMLYLQIDHFSVSLLQSLPDKGFWILFGFVAAFTVLIPLLTTNFLISTGTVSDWEMTNHQERTPVLIFSSLCLGCLYYLFGYVEQKNGALFYEFYGLLMSGIVLGLIGAGISYFWKISIHSMGISGLAGGMIALTASLDPLNNTEDMVFINSIVIAIVGVVGFARLYEKAHNISQVLAGMILGFSVSFIIVIQGWYI